MQAFPLAVAGRDACIGRWEDDLYGEPREWGVRLMCRNNPEFWLDVGLATLRARGFATDGVTTSTRHRTGEFVVRATAKGYRVLHSHMPWFYIDFALPQSVRATV